MLPTMGAEIKFSLTGVPPLTPNPDPHKVMGCFLNLCFCNCLGISGNAQAIAEIFLI
jgi:hypothetical protein